MIKKYVVLIMLSFVSAFVYSINSKSDIVKIETNGEYSKKINIAENIIPNDIDEPNSPGKIPSFWWSFFLSAIGTYLLWGIGLGPVSVLVVYYWSKKDKKEVNKSLWGWVVGTLLGGGLWALVNLVLRA